MNLGHPTRAAILAVNAGSSSVKFALYPCAGHTVAAAGLSGVVEGLEPGGQIRLKLQNQLQELAAPDVSVDKFAYVLQALRTLLRQQAANFNVVAVAHRIVHGGEKYTRSVVVNPQVLEYLQTLNTLAPLHQPHNLAGITAFQNAYPDVPQIACFDTGFHADMPVLEQVLALPKTLRDSGIRRYGFHGLSYRYVSAHLIRQSPRATQRVIMAHLGNGASLCAMLNGKSQATTMGFSALDGLMMGSRCGALDPGVLLHLMRQEWDVARIEKTLYSQSGLLGVSGISADMRKLRASDDEQAKLAIDLFTHRIVREAGALTACLGGLDVLAFTGGIGEHDAALRQQTCEALSYLGVRIDPELNRSAVGSQIVAIHDRESTIEVWVIPTDEGRVAAMDALELVEEP